jgi:hypothetical protein
MNRITFIIFLFVANFSISQKTNSTLPNYKFETIENIRLGLSKVKFINEMKTLKISNRDFSTNLFLSKKLFNPDSKELNLINSFYSNVFNFDEYKVLSNNIEHPALIHTESLDNNHITSLVLLLGHTGKAAGLAKEDSIRGKMLYFRQDIDQDLFFKIVDLYVRKYGQPEMFKDTTKHVKYYKIYEKNVVVEKQDSYNNYVIKWYTEYINIDIFVGFNNNAYFIPNKSYSASTNWSFSNLDDKPLEDYQKPCFTFPYIKYELNEKALKMLIINKLKL